MAQRYRINDPPGKPRKTIRGLPPKRLPVAAGLAPAEGIAAEGIAAEGTPAAWLQVFLYRLGQVRQQLGFVPPLSAQEYAEVERRLPPDARALFRSMSPADQLHSLRVCRGLQERGCTDGDMLVAALLHDVGKAQGRVPFWTRPVIVLGKMCAPALLTQLAVAPYLFGERIVPAWQRALSYAWWHAEIGAELAASAGLSERAVLYIRTHHQPHGPAAELHVVDEVS